MNIVVVKFGGTSVATEEGRSKAISHVEKLLNEGKHVVVVVSAMGRKGEPYATDTLISLLNKNSKRDTLDLLMSCGETISACVFADNLVQKGIDAIAVTGAQAGIITNGIFTKADIFDMDTNRIKAALYEDKVVVVTGFQGISVRNEVTTLGRGGSDTSAVVIGGFLNAESVHIFTDVPGIAVIDPRVVSKAKFMDQVNMENMYYLSCWGAGVIHPRAIAEAQKYSFDVFVRSTFDEGQGTKISKNIKQDSGPVGIAIMKDCKLFEPNVDDNLIVANDEVEKSVRIIENSNYSLISVLFNDYDHEEIKSEICHITDIANIYYSKSCAHLFVDSRRTYDIANDLYSNLFENVALNALSSNN